MIPNSRANTARSSGMFKRLDGLRSRRRLTSLASDAVLTLQFFYLRGQLVGLPDLALEGDEVL